MNQSSMIIVIVPPNKINFSQQNYYKLFPFAWDDGNKNKILDKVSKACGVIIFNFRSLTTEKSRKNIKIQIFVWLWINFGVETF